MRCPTLAELPPPPPGRTGWPWTEESKRRLPDQSLGGHAWPTISVVTPSFNQGEFLEEAIRSVLLQGYPDLEYFLFDGGSADNSVEIIRKYAPWLSYWVSASDSGQSDSINRGLNMASGEFATWINSDDMLCKNALANHATQVGFAKDVVYVGFCIYTDESSNPLCTHRGRIVSFEDLVRIKTAWRAEGNQGHIDQPAVLFPRALALSVGGLNTSNHHTMDYELWGRFLLAGANFQYTDIKFGMFRVHENQKTRDILQITESLLDTAAKLIVDADCLSEDAKKELLADLDAYRVAGEKNWWKGSGRLARMGLPPPVVVPLRNLRAMLRRAFASQSGH